MRYLRQCLQTLPLYYFLDPNRFSLPRFFESLAQIICEADKKNYVLEAGGGGGEGVEGGVGVNRIVLNSPRISVK